MGITPARQRRAARAMLLAAVLGLLTACATGLQLVPRVRLVEVVIVITTAVGAGAAFVHAWIRFRSASPPASPHADAPPPQASPGS